MCVCKRDKGGAGRKEIQTCKNEFSFVFQTLWAKCPSHQCTNPEKTSMASSLYLNRYFPFFSFLCFFSFSFFFFFGCNLSSSSPNPFLASLYPFHTTLHYHCNRDKLWCPFLLARTQLADCRDQYSSVPSMPICLYIKFTILLIHSSNSITGPLALPPWIFWQTDLPSAVIRQSLIQRGKSHTF